MSSLQGEYEMVLLGATSYVAPAAVTLTTAADKFVFTAHEPLEVVRWGIIISTLLDVGAGARFAMDKRIDFASDTGRVSRAGGVSSDIVADVLGGNIIYVDCPTAVELEPTQQVVIEAEDAPDTGGAGIAIVWYRKRPFVGSKLGDNVTDVSSV